MNDNYGAYQTPDPYGPPKKTTQSSFSWMSLSAFIFGIVALILAAVALALAVAPPSTQIQSIVYLASQGAINVNTGATILMASASQTGGLPIVDNVDGGAAYLCPVALQLTQLNVSLSNVVLVTPDNTPIFTATVWKSVAGTRSWSATTMSCATTIQDSSIFYQFSNTTASVQFGVNDRFMLVLTCGVTTADAVSVLASASLFFNS